MQQHENQETRPAPPCYINSGKNWGVEEKRHTVVYHDLDHLAGTWDKKDLSEFQKNVEDFEKIDEKMWK